jgi:two-component system sensor histidine kinase/response regulator
MGFALVLTTLSMGTACLVDYHLSRKSLEQQLGKELKAIVVSVAPLIDGDAVLRIDYDFQGEITDTEDFEAIRSVLLKVKNENRLKSNGSPLYIMRKAEDFEQTGELEFVVMTDRDDNGEYFVGNRYRALPHNREALAGAAASTGVYEDPLGLWISAAAPIRNSRGEVVALLQVDRPVKYFYEQVRTQVLTMFLVALITLIVGTFVAAVMARGIAKPLQELVTATQDLAKGELERRVQFRRRDELGDLGDSINAMAIQLEAARDEQARHQRELTSAWHEAEAASRAKTQFLATMSHELRTPLNGIVGFAGLLLDSDLAPDQRRCAETIELSGNNLRSIVDDILDYSKIEAERLVLENSRFELPALIENAMDVVSVAACAKGIELTCLIDAEVPRFAIGDSLRLRQVILNLLGNAIKFTNQGEVFLRAKSRIAGENLQLEISVEDTGIGIEAETLSRLFQPFSQADASTTRRYGGSGLGLSISKRLIQMMGGEIHVASAVGQGSLFRIHVTLGISGQMDPPVSLDNVRVLAISEHQRTRQVLSEYLFGASADAVVASGMHAMQEFDRAFEVVVLDAAGPEEAAEFLRSLRARRGPDPIVILLCQTAGGPPQTFLTQFGISECLPKPIRRSALYEAVQRALCRRPHPSGRTRSPLPREGRPPVKSLRVLVAEDNPVNSQLALRVLSNMGYPADHAKDGTHAVKAAESCSYDLILMDCHMPEMDGYEATRLIRLLDRRAGRHTRIVAMTANALPGDREKCLAAGMDDYLSKPFRQSDLAEALDRCAVVV